MSKENLYPNNSSVPNQSSERMSEIPQNEGIDPKRSKSWGEKILLWMYEDQSSKGSSEPVDVARSIASSLSEFSDPSQSWWVNLLLWGFLIAVLSGFIELISLLWQPLGMIFYGLYFFMISYLFFAFLILDANRLAHEALKTAWTFRLTLVLTIALIICFSQMSRHLYIMFGGFATKQTGYWDWLGFGTEQVADNALFDFLSIYGWHISTIQASGFWSRTVVFLFNIELEVIIIAVIVLQLKRLDLLHFDRIIAAGSIDGRTQKRFSNAVIGILNAMIGIFVGIGIIGLIIAIVLAVRGHAPTWWIWTITICAIPVGGMFGIMRDNFEKKKKQEP